MKNSEHLQYIFFLFYNQKVNQAENNLGVPKFIHWILPGRRLADLDIYLKALSPQRPFQHFIFAELI